MLQEGKSEFNRLDRSSDRLRMTPFGVCAISMCQTALGFMVGIPIFM